MASIPELIAKIDNVYRDSETINLPVSGAHDPVKSAIRELLKQIVELSRNSGTTLVFGTVDEMEAAPTSGLGVGDRAEVRTDAAGDVEGGNGVYAWSGSDWVWIDELERAELQRRVPRMSAPDPATPLIAFGADAVLWHDGEGVDFTPSPRLRRRLGLDGAAACVTSGEYQRRLRAKLAALQTEISDAKLNVLLAGDSWVRLPHLRMALEDMFTKSYPVAGEGFMSAEPNPPFVTGASYTLTSGWIVLDGTTDPLIYGLTPDGACAYTEEAGEVATISNLPCTRFSIYVRENAGTWRYRVDGGAWTTVNDAGGAVWKRVQITGLEDTEHDFEIESISGTVVLAGFYSSRDGSGIEISRFGDGGATASILSGYVPSMLEVISDEPPDLIITILGTNDARDPSGLAEAYVGFMDELISAARIVKSDTSVIHIIPPQNGEAVLRPTTDYRDALWRAREALQSDYISLSEFYGTYAQANALGLWWDTVHPSDLAGAMISNLLNDLLIRI